MHAILCEAFVKGVCKAQDGNPAENLLTGTVSWTFSATTDLLCNVRRKQHHMKVSHTKCLMLGRTTALPQDWQVYIADDTQGDPQCGTFP